MVLVFALDLLLQPFCGPHELSHAHGAEQSTFALVQEHQDCHLHTAAYSCVHHAPCIPASVLLAPKPPAKTQLNDGFDSLQQSPGFIAGLFRPPRLS